MFANAPRQVITDGVLALSVHVAYVPAGVFFLYFVTMLAYDMPFESDGDLPRACRVLLRSPSFSILLFSVVSCCLVPLPGDSTQAVHLHGGIAALWFGAQGPTSLQQCCNTLFLRI